MATVRPGSEQAAGFFQAGDRLPALPALHALSAAGRDLLARTAQLPAGERELLAILTEYRHAVFAFTTAAEKL